MVLTRDEAKALAPILAAFGRGAKVFVNDGGKWSDTGDCLVVGYSQKNVKLSNLFKIREENNNG